MQRTFRTRSIGFIALSFAIAAALTGCGSSGQNCVVYDAGAGTQCANPASVYTWNGDRCLPTDVCSCDGGACPNTYATQAQCLDDHRACSH